MPLLRSLNTKLLLIVVCLVTLSGVVTGWWQGEVEAERLQKTYDGQLRTLLYRYRNDIAQALQERADVLSAARDSLVVNLGREQGNSLPEDFAQARDPDGAYRDYEGDSGLFIHRDTVPDAELRRLIQASGRLWRHTEALLQVHFDAFYLISRERMTRIWPGEIVADHRADHDVTQEIFYTYADPENNPEREARWTPIYFDHYTQTWMLSLLVPVYHDEQFLGVMGADLGMGYLFGQLEALEDEMEVFKAFIFNADGELIFQGGQQASDAVAQHRYQLLNGAAEMGEGLSAYIAGAIAGDYPMGPVRRHRLHGESHHISHYRLPDMDWYLSLSYPGNLINQHYRRTMVEIVTHLAAPLVFLILVLFYGLKFLVTDRIGRLAHATSRVNADNWQVQVPEAGEDEISRLGHSINNMLDKINDLFRGLNNNIAQLEVANVEAQKLFSAIEQSSSLVVILDRNWRLEYANSQFWKMSGYRAEEELSPEQALMLDWENRDEHFFGVIESTLRAKHSAQSEEGNTSHPEWRTEYQARRRDGTTFWLLQSVSAIAGAEGDPQYYICVGQDISNIKENQRQMESLAYYDQLTGLQNRILFKEQLRGALSSTEREQDHLALLYLDLDHFKRINDTLGHEAGDQLLIEVANRLRGCLRSEDAVARLGGDEFAVLLKHVDSAQYSFVVANKIILALNEPILLLGQEVVVGVSIGITLAPDDSRDLDVLMKNADLAMYQAKYHGRNVFQFYTSEMNREVEDRLNLEGELRQAIKNNEFELYYQPQVDLRSGEIVGAEALIRWHNPKRGLVAPDEFIPVVEDSGLIVPIGKWVIRAACQQARSIQKALHKDIKIAINVSARQLNDPHFVEDFKSVLQEVRLDPSCLELEITESTLMADTDSVLSRLHLLRALGVSLAIDDFGTGYSSLSILKRLPIDSLKVDRSFVQDLPDDEEDRAITSLIVAMANSLSYNVVVEGVETIEQLDFLRRCGCGYAQGYYFSRPMPADALMVNLFEWCPFSQD